MRSKPPPILEAGRIRHGPMGSDASYGMNGLFQIKPPMGKGLMVVIVSDGVSDPTGWEHASVSLEHRTPRWEEMSYVKRLVWEPSECVVQYHPPEIDYVNIHPHCLHLWRHLQGEFALPPLLMV